ncbi:MAG TPA: CvpA family protein [Methylomirabilota bacterium]|nr:CvpA family protein [Methylomirabilota bacterium]
MIAAAVQPVVKQMTWGWFDIVVLCVLAFGLFRGRRNGMSQELLPLFQWLILVSVCAFLYPMAGQFYINTFHWGKLTSYICGYITLAFVVLLIFGILRKLFGERLGKSGAFKGGEYYLGILSGLIRTACILIVVLAFLNAPVYTEADVQAHAAYVKKNLGGDMYSGDYFPTLQQVQEQVFKNSCTGPFVKENLGMLLINNTATPLPAKPQPKIMVGGQ